MIINCRIFNCVPGSHSLIAALWLVVVTGPVWASSNLTVHVQASLAADGRSFTLSAPGFTGFTGGWSARIFKDGKQRVLSSSGGIVRTGQVTTIRFPDVGLELLFRVDSVPGSAGMMAQAGIRNTGAAPVSLMSLSPVEAKFRVTGNAKDWLVTRLDTSATAVVPPVVALIDKPMSVHEYGGYYRRDGLGFLFGPVGSPSAYVNASFEPSPDGFMLLAISAEMSDVPVDPGETRWGQQVVLLFKPPRLALSQWAKWVGQSHGARTDKGALSGWNSWYYLARNITGSDLLAIVDSALKNPDRLHPAVIQIDDCYLNPAGSTETNDQFPEGLSFYAKRIAETGARPGLFLDLWSGESRKWLSAERERFIRDTADKGFTYLKVLYKFSGKVSDCKQTRFEAARANYAAMRRAAGEVVFLHSSNGEPDRACVGAMDGGRVGANVTRDQIRSRINDVLRSYHLHGRWFAIDVDGYYMGTDIANISQIAGGWPLVRTWMSMVGLSCGMAFTSDPWYWESFKPYWRNVEVMTPPAKEQTEVMDLCTSEEWPRLVGHVHREWGDWTVALLWNPSTREQAITLDFKQAGMDHAKRYAVWSFWDDRYLGVAEGTWTTPQLAASASQHLVFTEVDPTSSLPVFIGSNLHIYCGAADLKRVQAGRTFMTVELTEAGARDGFLFIYSRYQPVLRTASGCLVDGIVSAGENVWRISLHDRKRGMAQRIDMDIILPVTKQLWFWSLIATVIASLVFATWRYMVGLRSEREHAIERERSRIAQDLHDDLGAELSSIAMMSDLAQDEAGENRGIQSRLHQITGQAQQTVRRLEEIVWAVNPANDTVERFVSFFCKFAQAYLELSGVASRFDVAGELPDLPLTSLHRHNLFLAAKEALHNAVRHGQPTEVTLNIALRDRELIVTVADNGCGFIDTPGLSMAHGSGNMRQRMKAVGGKFKRNSTPGKGTVVELTLPVQRTQS
ncbi:MAG: histidine kinase [bacterium]